MGACLKRSFFPFRKAEGIGSTIRHNQPAGIGEFLLQQREMENSRATRTFPLFNSYSFWQLSSIKCTLCQDDTAKKHEERENCICARDVPPSCLGRQGPGIRRRNCHSADTGSWYGGKISQRCFISTHSPRYIPKRHVLIICKLDPNLSH